MQPRVGLIGGTGVYHLDDGVALTLETPYGDVAVTHHRLNGHDVFFTNRHGTGHALPPHRLNPRATLDALARCGVTRVVALNAVGSLRAGIPTPSLLVPDDFIDFSGRHATYHDAEAVHADMTTPYCPGLGAALARTRGATPLARGGVYACTHGPRLETAAEVRMLGTFAHVVGMTGYPEVALARERGLCYASLCLVANPGAGLAPQVSARDIRAEVDALRAEAVARALDALTHAGPDPCRCTAWMEGARLAPPACDAAPAPPRPQL